MSILAEHFTLYTLHFVELSSGRVVGLLLRSFHKNYSSFTMATDSAVGRESNRPMEPSISQHQATMEKSQNYIEQMVQCVQTMEIFVQQLSETQNVMKSELHDGKKFSLYNN